MYNSVMKNILFILCLISSTVVPQLPLFAVPNVTIEMLNTGALRVYIPHITGMDYFIFSAKLNEDLTLAERGLIFGETRKRNGNFWVITLSDEYNNWFKTGDTIYYWATAFAIDVNFKTVHGSWTIKELQSSFSPLSTPGQCQGSATVLNGGQTSCVGKLIINDEFSGKSVDRNKWIVEQLIPTYTGPNYEFNSYKDKDQTRYIQDGKLFLKPIAIRNELEVRGDINLTNGCTSEDPSQCYYHQMSSFLLPPVLSAKIRSKTTFKYGKIEIKAKLPLGDWIYPIMELEPKEKIDGEECPKIWIAYSRGNIQLRGGNHDYGSKVLFGGPVLSPYEPGRSKALATKYSKTPYGLGFHIYTLDWTPGRIALYVDNIVYGDIYTSEGFADPSIGLGAKWTGPEAPFNREHYLTLGVAVGGLNDFPDGFNSGADPKPWRNDERNYIKNFFDARNVWLKTWIGDKSALKIEYVKVTAV